MATRNRALHLASVGRGGEHEMFVTIPDPVLKKDPVLARIAIAGGGQVVIQIEAFELDQVADFLRDVAGVMRELEAERKGATA